MASSKQPSDRPPFSPNGTRPAKQPSNRPPFSPNGTRPAKQPSNRPPFSPNGTRPAKQPFNRPPFSPNGTKPTKPLTKTPSNPYATEATPSLLSQKRKRKSGGCEGSRLKKAAAVDPCLLDGASLKEKFSSEEAPSSSHGVVYDEEHSKRMWALLESVEKDVKKYFPVAPDYVPTRMDTIMQDGFSFSDLVDSLGKDLEQARKRGTETT